MASIIQPNELRLLFVSNRELSDISIYLDDSQNYKTEESSYKSEIAFKIKKALNCNNQSRRQVDNSISTHSALTYIHWVFPGFMSVYNKKTCSDECHAIKFEHFKSHVPQTEESESISSKKKQHNTT